MKCVEKEIKVTKCVLHNFANYQLFLTTQHKWIFYINKLN